MPLLFLIPLALGVGAYGGWKTNDIIDSPPASLPNGNSNGGFNLTTAFGYVVLGGLVYYFGKKIIK